MISTSARQIIEEIVESKIDRSEMFTAFDVSFAAKKEGLVKDLEALMIKYTFKSRKNQTMYLGVIQSLSKIIDYIEE